MNNQKYVFERFCNRLSLSVFSSLAFCFAAMVAFTYFNMFDAFFDAYAGYFILTCILLAFFVGPTLARIFGLAVPLLVISTIFVFSIEKFNMILEMPDLNADSEFTFRDFFHGIFLVVFEVGERYTQSVFGEITESSKFVVFFEISANFAQLVSKVALTCFTWFCGVGWFVLLWNADLHSWTLFSASNRDE